MISVRIVYSDGNQTNSKIIKLHVVPRIGDKVCIKDFTDQHIVTEVLFRDLEPATIILE